MHNHRDIALFILDLIFPFSETRKAVEAMPPSTFLERAERNDSYLPEGLSATFCYKNKLVRSAVKAMKYNGSKHSALLLSSGMYEDILGTVEDLITFEKQNIILLPVPLSKNRLSERGFNQAEILAQYISQNFKEPQIPIVTDTVLKIKDVPSQTKLNRKERFQNMRGAFQVSNPDKVKDSNIIVVDDVITTGATCSEIRKTLLEAGASSVECFAAAH